MPAPVSAYSIGPAPVLAIRLPLQAASHARPSSFLYRKKATTTNPATATDVTSRRIPVLLMAESSTTTVSVVVKSELVTNLAPLETSCYRKPSPRASTTAPLERNRGAPPRGKPMVKLRPVCCQGSVLPTQNRAAVIGKSSRFARRFRAFCLFWGQP